MDQNPLAREFISLETISAFFNVTEAWVMRKVSEGKLTCHRVGKKTRLFYIPEVRECILGDFLAPDMEKNNDTRDRKRQWRHRRLSGAAQALGEENLQMLRLASGSAEMD